MKYQLLVTVQFKVHDKVKVMFRVRLRFRFRFRFRLRFLLSVKLKYGVSKVRVNSYSVKLFLE